MYLGAALIACGSLSWAQTESPAPAPAAPTVYLLGAEDEIVIRALEMEEEISDKPFRIDASGYIRVPMAGRVKAAGLTTQELEDQIASLLRPYIKKPQVTVTVTEMRSNPISILGAVKTPGVHQMQGPKTLAEALSLAGGLTDESGFSIKITRRIGYGMVPLEGAKLDETGEFSVAEVSVNQLLEARNPKINIVVMPHDVITVPRAQMIYVVGEVVKSGAFTLREREQLSVLQAVALAEGISQTGKRSGARILRPDPVTNSRREIPVDLDRIMAGKTEDFYMRADDVLFIPGNMAKSATLRAVEAAIQIGTGVVIWRR